MGTDQYARLRFGIGSNFEKGRQIEYVLGKFDNKEKELLPTRLDIAIEIIKNFALTGVQNTMNLFNNNQAK